MLEPALCELSMAFPPRVTPRFFSCFARILRVRYAVFLQALHQALFLRLHSSSLQELPDRRSPLLLDAVPLLASYILAFDTPGNWVKLEKPRVLGDKLNPICPSGLRSESRQLFERDPL